MNVEWSSEKTFQLIESFKKHPILWNCKNKSYKDRKKKALAWNIISATLGEHIDHCKRRIESLLASCRRERCKILKSCAEDEPQFIYTPKWIYWKHFAFMRDEAGIPNDSDFELATAPTGSEDSEWPASSRRPVRKRKKSVKELSEANPPEMYSSLSVTRGCDEFQAFGITVASKLRKMDPTQRLYAESIINTILYKGATFQLSSDFETLFFQPMPQPTEFQSEFQPNSLDNVSKSESQWSTQDIITGITIDHENQVCDEDASKNDDIKNNM